LSLFFTDAIHEKLKEYVSDESYSSIVILVDENTDKHCYPLIQEALPGHHKIVIKSGEAYKTLETCKQIWTELTNYQLDRNSLLINLGGGVIGDMGGFCAATYKRGIDFINLPTTLLSQVDASIGGKLGIDFKGFKNHIGLFKDPNAILIDTVFLKTLSKNEFLSGFAEIIKHSIIASEEQWNYLSSTPFEDINFAELIPKSVAIKKRVVEEDPYEKGKRKILNFGHTVGHAIESFYLDSDSHLLHGEAIAIGMICESYIARKLNLLSEKENKLIENFIRKHYRTHQSIEDDIEGIYALALQDKKNKASKILMSLPNGIGSAQFDIEVNQQLFVESLNYYSSH